MSLSRKLQEGASFYRRRGPRVEPNRYVRGATYADGGELSGRHPLPAGTLGEEYDPTQPQYQTVSEYGPQEPWDGIALEPRTPEMRLDPPIHPAPDPRDPRTVDEMLIEQAITKAKALGGPLETVDHRLDDDLWLRPPSTISPDLQYLVPIQADGDPESSGLASPSAQPPQSEEWMEGTPLADQEPPDPEFFEPQEDAFDVMGKEINAMIEGLDSMAGPGVQPDSLDDRVLQLEAEQAMEDRIEPDAVQMMEQHFDHVVKMMDQLNMMGPMG